MRSMSAGCALTALLVVAPLDGGESPESRALVFLSREVPRWSRENGCFSCHNNGDAARALFAAEAAGLSVERDAMADTLAWLSRPSGWDDNGDNPGSSDLLLARIQFASALEAAIAAGLLAEPSALREAAELIASEQAVDGSFPLDESASIGSPATYGLALATAAARNVLAAASSPELEPALAHAEEWLRGRETKTVIDAAAILLGLGRATDAEAEARRAQCLEVIRDGRAPSGGWGPYLVSPEEPFDTALVLLALTRLPETKETAAWIRDGRQYLLAAQLEGGSWPETTRPPGQQSYAQYISTTGWATLALLATRDRGGNSPR